MNTSKLNSYLLTGTVIDSDNQLVNVRESTSKIDRAIDNLKYYTDNFNNVNLTLTIKTLL